MNQSYQITLPDIEISSVDSEEKPSIRDKILMLHYFTLARGTPLTNKIITYKELPGGDVYFPTFSKRTIKPLLSNFGEEPERLLKAAESLGGHKEDYGDVAITIDVFSCVPITLVLWRGDDEFPPAGNFLFDNTISNYLTSEDITVLCETLVWRLIKGSS